MINMIKKVTKYLVLFLSLYICSIIVVNIFVLAGAEFENRFNTAFIGTLTAMIFLYCIKYFTSRKVKIAN